MAETTAPIGLGVKLPFATAAEFMTRYRENVTRGGVYLRAKKVLPPGTLVNLDLKLTNGDRLIHGSAVVHFVTGQNNSGPSGLGLKFLGLDEASKKFLDEMLAGLPSASNDSPPIPAGVGPVQYAEKPPQDTAVTQVMTVQPQDFFGAQPVPMPAPSTSAPADPFAAPAIPPAGADPASEPLPLPAPAGFDPPAAPAASVPPVTDPLDAPAADPFGSPAWPAATDPLPIPPPSSEAPYATPAGGLPFDPPAPAASEPAPSPPVEVTSFPSPSEAAPASAVAIDTSVLDRLEVDPTDPRAVLGLRPHALPDEAGAAAARMKADLHLDEPADAITTRLRKLLSQRLDAAVEALVRPAVKDSPATAAARSLIDGDPQAAYATGSDSVDASAKAIAFAAACAMAAQTHGAEWIEKATALAKEGANAAFFGNSWILLAQAAHAAGDASEVKKALAEAAKQDPANPFVATAKAPGKSSSLMSVILLIVGLAGGFAGGMYGGPKLGLTGGTKPIAVATKTEPAKTEPAKVEPPKTEPAKTEPAATAAAEPAKAEPPKTEPAKTEPAKTEPATTVAAAEPAKTEPAKTEPAKTEPAAATKPPETATSAAPKLSPAEEKKKIETEAALLSKVEAAMGRDEPCVPFLADLGEVVATSPKAANIGKAMILRARCFDANSKSAQARAEYKKYAKWFPRGPYIEEARDSN